MAGVATVALMLIAAPAWAAPSTEIVQGRYVRIVSVADWQAAANLRTGHSVSWDLTISADAPGPGTLALGISALGETPLTVDATLCSQDWEAGGCPGATVGLRSAWDVPLDGSLTVLSEQSTAGPARLRLVVSLGSGGGGDPAPTSVLVHVRGFGETTVVSSDPALAVTGAPSATPQHPLLIASIALLIGLAVQLHGRRSRRKDRGGA